MQSLVKETAEGNQESMLIEISYLEENMFNSAMFAQKYSIETAQVTRQASPTRNPTPGEMHTYSAIEYFSHIILLVLLSFLLGPW